MAFLPTNASQVQQFAVALYGIKVGSSTMAQVQADITLVGGLNKALNAYYTASFGTQTTAAVGTLVAANLGLTGTAATDAAAYITAVLNGTAASARGEAIQGVLSLFSTLTANATYGAAATAWNTKVEAAIAYTGTTDAVAGATLPGVTLSLAAGADILNTTTTTVANQTTAGDDTIYASADGTLGSTDIVDGGAGTDTILSGQTAADNTIAPVLSNVEVVTLTVTPADTKTFDFSAATVTGLQTLNVKGAGAVDKTGADELITVSGLAKTTTVGIIGGTASTGTTSSNITATFTSAAAADTQNVAISSLGKVGVLTLSTAETVNIAATGTGTTGANTIGSLAATAVKTLNITGSGDLTIAASDLAAAVTVNASAATGEIAFTGETAATSTTFTGGSGATTVTTASTGTVAVTTGAGKDTVDVSGGNSSANISTGEGNDRVLVGAQANVTTADVINAGTGTDTIVISDAAVDATTKTALATALSGFEIVETTAATATTIDFNALSAYDTVRVSAAQAAAYNGTVATAGATSLTVVQENADVLVLSASRAGVSGGSAVGTSSTNAGAGAAGGDALNIAPKLDNGTNAATVKFVGAVTLAGGVGELSKAAAGAIGGTGGDALDASTVETLNLIVAGTQAAAGTADTVTLTLGAGGSTGAGAASVGTNGSSLVVGTNATVVLTSELDSGTATAALHNNITLGTIVGSNVTLNGTAFLGNISATAATGNVTLNGGAGKDALTGGAGLDTLNGGAGADTLNGAAGADTYTGGAGRDSIAISATGVTAGLFDTVTDFGKVTTALTAAQVATTSTTNAFGTAIAAATTLGGAETDLLIFAATATLGGVQASTDVKAAVTGAVTINAVETAKGVLSISGADAASVDTLAEWVAVANIMAATDGNIVSFEFAGSTYVFQQLAAGPDTLVQLVGVTGVTGSVVAGSSVAAAVGDIFVA